MHSHRLKNNCLWQIKTPSKPSWSWRKILQSRDWSRGLFRKTIGNGSSTHLWLDYWLPGGFCISDSISASHLFHRHRLESQSQCNHLGRLLVLPFSCSSPSTHLGLHPLSPITRPRRSLPMGRSPIWNFHHCQCLGKPKEQKSHLPHLPSPMVS